MSERRQYICDMCGAIRGEANHWWLARDVISVLEFFPWSALPDLSPTAAKQCNHLCGQGCAGRLLGIFMSKGQQ